MGIPLQYYRKLLEEVNPAGDAMELNHCPATPEQVPRDKQAPKSASTDAPMPFAWLSG